MSAAAWDKLERELAAWAEAGRTATLWWRDDDATAPSKALDRLLAVAAADDIPLAIAVIPAEAQLELAERLRGCNGIAVLQHGFAHANHASEGEKKAELGAHRPLRTVAAELSRGRKMLAALFGEMLRPVLVPPWNRIAPALVTRLPAVGIAGLSTDGPRETATPAPGLTQVNAHVDLHRKRRFVGTDAAIEQFVRHLAARRAGAVDPSEPTGILTHHLVQTPACWRFLAELAGRVSAHRGARWLAAPEIFDAARLGGIRGAA